MHPELRLFLLNAMKKELESVKEELAKLKAEEEKGSTKNTKGNRKVVRAVYYAPESVFKIPDGLDLEDESIVESWGVKWNKLYINYVDGREEEIDPYLDCEDNTDYKYPKELEIEDPDNNPYSEDEED